MTSVANACYSHCVIPDIEAHSDLKFVYVPVLLGGIFKATNNVSPAVSMQGVLNKPDYSRIETERWLQRYPVAEFEPNPHFPVNTLMMMRGAIFAEDKEYSKRYVDAMFDCMWGSPRKMDELEVLNAALEEYDLPVAAILAGIQDPEVKQRLIDSTNTAVERGAFGSPTFFLGDEIYFGKEKLRDIEEAVSGA